MRALQLHAMKEPARLTEVPEPEPGPGQVLVRIGGAGACHSDLHLMHDFEPGLLPWGLPFTLGHENAGWVEALGAGVSGIDIGQPVAVYGPWGCGRCHRCVQGMENYCELGLTASAAAGGLGADGGMAHHMVVPSVRHLVPLVDLDPVDAAPLTDAGLTPYHAIKRSWHKLVPGSHAVVIGLGGLGHLAVQILEACTPATVIAVDTRAEALELAAGAGAEHTVEAGPEAIAAVHAATGGKGADLTLDVVGSDDTLALAAGVTRSLGDVALLGIAGGSHAFGFFTAAYEVSFASTYWGSVSELHEVIALAEAGHIAAHVERFDLEQAPEAYERLARGEINGRAVIVPG